MSKYNLNEIIEFGIQIEKNGFDFYVELAWRIESKTLTELFEYLAQEEKGHILAFKSIQGRIEEPINEELLNSDFFSYMHSLAAEYVFTTKDKVLEIIDNIEDDMEAINLALKFEKESIKFFETMEKGLEEKEIVVIEKLIAEEKKHIIKLEELKETL